jgi:PAS domain S-box-containing protein
MNKKILVVDNDYFFVEFLSELLSERGYEVVKAYDGKDAMENLENTTFDYLFVDMVMPKIDGWQLIKYVRDRFPGKPFPIIAVSGTIMEQLDGLDRIGADYYIIKGPLERMRQQIIRFLDDLEEQATGNPENEKQKLIYDPGSIYPRRESSELIESLQFQKAIFENIGLGLVVVDQDGKSIQVNHLALRFLACKSEKVMNHPVTSLFSSGVAKRLIQCMRETVRDPVSEVRSIDLSEGGKDLRLIVSLFRIEDRQAGWIIAIEEMAQ